MKNRLLLLMACTFATLSLFAPAFAANLGTANDYNLFVFEDFYAQTGSGIGGNVAIGGNAYMSSYSVARQLQGNNAKLVVDGDLTWEVYGTVGNDGSGNIYVGGTSNIRPNTVAYNEPCLPQNIVDFSAARSYLNQASSIWSTQASTGTVSLEWGTLDLVGSSTELNVFNLTTQELDINTLNITAPADSTVLVNVSGSNVIMENFGMFLKNGLTSNYVLFNFYEATSLKLTGCEFNGSILAPDAAIDFQYPILNGTLIGKSIGEPYTRCGTMYHVPFQGDLPAVPEPATLLLFVSGAFLLAENKKISFKQ